METTKPTAVVPKARPINICTAREEAQQWQTMNPNRAKGFLVEVGDFLACFEEMGIATYDSRTGTYTVNEKAPHDIRIYMATSTDPSSHTDPTVGYGNKLLIVGTKKDGSGKWTDIIDRTSLCPATDGYSPTDAVAGSPNGSGVYNFTHPCPSECDPNPGSL